MNHRGIALLLIGLLGAASACTSSATSSVQTGAGNQYDSQYRGQTTSTRGTYEQKPAEEKDGDAAITIMQLALETGDVYPGEDYYVHAVVDNPTDRKNVEYVWSVSSGELTEVPEAERGRLQALVEDKYSSATPAAATEVAPAPVPQSGNLPAGATTIQPSEGAPAPVEAPLGGTPASPTVPAPGGQPASGTVIQGTGNPAAAAPPPVSPEEIEAKRLEAERMLQQQREADEAAAERSGSGVVKTNENRMTRGTSRAYEKRIVAGPEDDAYFSDEDQAEISYDAGNLSEEEKAALDALAEDQRTSIENRANRSEVRGDESDLDLRSGQRRLIDERDEPQGSTNASEGGMAGDPFETPDRRDTGWSARPTKGEVDAQRYGTAGQARLESDLADATLAGSALRRGADGEAAPAEITAEAAYERFTLVTDEPFVRWSPTRPGEAKIFVKVRWKTDDLTAVTELPVEVRLREPKVAIADDDFPDMVREDEPLFIRVDGDNLPAFHKGLFTLSFDPDVLSFREAELGEFFDDARGADLFYMQPDKLSGKVILAIDSNTELANLTGGGPLLYVKFKAKRDIASRGETQLALVQDTASQYVLDDAGDNILPLAVEHPVYATTLVMPAAGAGGFDRALTPGEPTPGQQERAREEQAAAAAAGTAPGGAAQPAAAAQNVGPQRTPPPAAQAGPVDPNMAVPPGGVDPRLGPNGQPLEQVAP